MDTIVNLDQQTMFTVNALLLVVFAIAFAFAGFERQDRKYWCYMLISNVVFAVAFLIFSKEIGAESAELFLPNLLLFIGLSLRWNAIREFFGHPVSLAAMTAPPLIGMIIFAFSPWLRNSITFGALNLLITLQIVMIIWAIASEPEALKSKWGLIASYAVLVLSSFLRVMQGWLFDTSMVSMLPADVFLHLNLIAAAVHISASGAFSLLIAYERNANNLQEIALRDPLTGLLNRWSIETITLPSESKISPKLISAIMIDIDHFKLINDSYGHSTGDAALRHLAMLIKDAFPQEATIARVGGEEFMILAYEQGASKSAEICALLRKKLAENPFQHGDLFVPFTISIGICSAYVNTRADIDHIWNRADEALYIAKSSGRDRTKIADNNSKPI
ncbi:GGDEF domain-containing protein [Brucella pseudogrignonensis]|uniref:diguanylate cyclase n=1 Tax=Brucella pseudogrignonensis TaxID=419475 RepID=A0ABU1MC81_9HYPH|nr:GGDEF domain-containing protein [Brucella pseudogrignonensis]MDR6433646.1 diguanylate cyclase (GGDEF)-like protein [Brucella pseudogrignonensis]